MPYEKVKRKSGEGMNQQERRQFLIRRLLDEQPRYRTMELPSGEAEQRRLLRSLFNLRMPGRIDEAFSPYRTNTCGRRQGRRASPRLPI